MWIRQKNWKHRISIGMLPFVQMQMWSTTMTKWITTCSDQSECECFVGLEIPSYTGPPQSCTCLTQGQTTLVSYYHSSFAFIVIFTLRTNGILALVTLSWDWANQSSSYNNNAHRITRTRWGGQMSYSTRLQTCVFESHNLPKWEPDAQLIWPPHLVRR